MSSNLVSEIVSFVKDHQISIHCRTATQRIEQLVAIDLGGTHDQWGVGIFLAITCENPNLLGAKLLAKLLVL